MLRGNGYGYGYKGRYSPELMDHYARGPAEALRRGLTHGAVRRALRSVHAGHLPRHPLREGAEPLPRIRAAYDAALRDVDVLVLPTQPLRATALPPADAPMAEYVARALEMIGNTAPFDVTGHPAISVPAEVTDGRPDRDDDRRPALRRARGPDASPRRTRRSWAGSPPRQRRRERRRRPRRERLDVEDRPDDLAPRGRRQHTQARENAATRSMPRPVTPAVSSGCGCGRRVLPSATASRSRSSQRATDSSSIVPACSRALVTISLTIRVAASSWMPHAPVQARLGDPLPGHRRGPGLRWQGQPDDGALQARPPAGTARRPGAHRPRRSARRDAGRARWRRAGVGADHPDLAPRPVLHLAPDARPARRRPRRPTGPVTPVRSHTTSAGSSARAIRMLWYPASTTSDRRPCTATRRDVPNR